MAAAAVSLIALYAAAASCAADADNPRPSGLRACFCSRPTGADAGVWGYPDHYRT
jgi:hypothetical protein